MTSTIQPLCQQVEDCLDFKPKEVNLRTDLTVDDGLVLRGQFIQNALSQAYNVINDNYAAFLAGKRVSFWLAGGIDVVLMFNWTKIAPMQQLAQLAQDLNIKPEATNIEWEYRKAGVTVDEHPSRLGLPNRELSLVAVVYSSGEQHSTIPFIQVLLVQNIMAIIAKTLGVVWNIVPKELTVSSKEVDYTTDVKAIEHFYIDSPEVDVIEVTGKRYLKDLKPRHFKINL